VDLRFKCPGLIHDVCRHSFSRDCEHSCSADLGQDAPTANACDELSRTHQGRQQIVLGVATDALAVAVDVGAHATLLIVTSYL